ncbi:MAG: phage tail protein [Calditrichaeota bacterium]|nr:MAG: phage tail protein [Calditrichota bacterium]
MPIIGNPPLSFRFGVTFFAGGVVPNPIDIQFRKVSGLGTSISTESVEEGGQNFYTQQLPKKVEHENLVLERGLVVGSPLTIEFNVAMSLFEFVPSNVLITLLDRTSIPAASWLLMNAFPVKWHVSDLDANANEVVIETMELSYQRMQIIRI